eukprot:4037187-Pyramimonas_sp.AAC.1
MYAAVVHEVLPRRSNLPHASSSALGAKWPAQGCDSLRMNPCGPRGGPTHPGQICWPGISRNPPRLWPLDLGQSV